MSIKLTGATSGSIELDVPAAVSGGDVSLTLPNGVGSANQYLKNGSTAGTLEFGAIATSALPTGAILQVRATYVDTPDSQAITANTRVNISQLSVSITPTTLTSNMLVFVRWNGESSLAGQYDSVFGLRRGSTDLGLQSSVGNRATGMQMTAVGHWASNADSTPDSANWFYLDEDDRTASGQITYNATVIYNQNSTLYNQRSVGSTDGVTFERPTSSILVMEVAA
jgi:hypothetical protein